MNLAQSISNYVAQHRNLAGLMYVALIVICGVITLSMLTAIVDRYHARDTSLDTLARLQDTELSVSKGGVPPGAPFLEGQTLTTASATLLQRITSIITKAGGAVISSEMVQRDAQSKDGYVTAIANCELEQDALQKVLYEIEAGMPFLFIEQLQIRVPLETGQAGRPRVLLGRSRTVDRGKVMHARRNLSQLILIGLMTLLGLRQRRIAADASRSDCCDGVSNVLRADLLISL